MRGRPAPRNALKHGLTAREIVLPTEDADAFRERRERWHDAYRPSTPAAAVVVERAVHANWRLDRRARAETARMAARVRNAVEDAQREALDRAEALGRRLVFAPADRFDTDGYRDPVLRERLDRREADPPATLARALQASSEGVDWLLVRWDKLRQNETACALRGSIAGVHKFPPVEDEGEGMEDGEDTEPNKPDGAEIPGHKEVKGDPEELGAAGAPGSAGRNGGGPLLDARLDTGRRGGR